MCKRVVSDSANDCLFCFECASAESGGEERRGKGGKRKTLGNEFADFRLKEEELSAQGCSWVGGGGEGSE